jgi:hypothetical protein
VPALVGVTLVAFVLVQVSGDITQVLLPAEATAEQRAEFRQAYGLDRPLPLQYVTYVGQIDREAQRDGRLWMGIHGNQEQDNAIAESMGPVG